MDCWHRWSQTSQALCDGKGSRDRVMFWLGVLDALTAKGLCFRRPSQAASIYMLIVV